MCECDVSMVEGMKFVIDMVCVFFEIFVCEGSEEIYEFFYEVV